MDLSLIHFVSTDPSETLVERTANLFPVPFTRESIPNFPMSADDVFLVTSLWQLQARAPSNQLVADYRAATIDEATFERRCRMELVAHVSQMALVILRATQESQRRGLQGIAMICNSPGKCQCRIIMDMFRTFQAKNGDIENAIFQGYRF